MVQPSTQCSFTAICSTCQVSAIVHTTRMSKPGAVGAPCQASCHPLQREKNAYGPTLMVCRLQTGIALASSSFIQMGGPKYYACPPPTHLSWGQSIRAWPLITTGSAGNFLIAT